MKPNNTGGCKIQGAGRSSPPEKMEWGIGNGGAMTEGMFRLRKAACFRTSSVSRTDGQFLKQTPHP